MRRYIAWRNRHHPIHLGGKLAVSFLEKVLDWVISRYPEVELVGMEDLVRHRKEK